MIYHQMSYKEICAIIRNVLSGPDKAVYANCTRPAERHAALDPFLEAILKEYPPYGVSWESFCAEYHQIKAKSQRLETLQNLYQLPIFFESHEIEQAHFTMNNEAHSNKLNIARNLLNKLKEAIIDPRYHHILINDEDNIKEIENLRTARWHSYLEEVEIKASNSLAILQENFIHYVDSLDNLLKDMEHNRKHYLNLPSKLFFLNTWLNEQTANSQEEAYCSLISTINKAVVCSHAINSKVLQRPTHYGNNTFLIASLNILILDICAKNITIHHQENIHSATKTNIFESVIDTLIKPFVQKDLHVPNCYHATSLLYDTYKKALDSEHRLFTTMPHKPSEYNLESEQILIDRMGQILGFGSEHIELILSIVGQDLIDLKKSQDILPGLTYLKNWELIAPQEIKNQRDHWDFHAAKNIYLGTIKKNAMQNPCKKTVISLLPLDFDKKFIFNSFLRNMIQEARQAQKDYVSTDKRRLLSYCCTADIFVRLLREKTAELEQQEIKNLLLCHFCMSGSLEAVRILYERGANPLAIYNSHNESAISLASKYGHTPIVRFLLDHISIKELQEENTSVQIGFLDAIRCSHIEIIQLLLQKDPFLLNHRSFYQETPLMIAARFQNYQEVIKLLLSFPDIDVTTQNYCGKNALMLAAEYNNFSTVQLLLKHMESNNIERGITDKKAIDLTSCFGVKELLIEQRPGEMALSRPLQLISAVFSKDRLEIQNLIDDKYPVNEANSFGNTALMLAASLNDSETVEKLLRQPDININATTIYGTTALMIAVKKRHAEIASMLLKHPDIDIEAQNTAGYDARLLAEDPKIITLIDSLTDRQSILFSVQGRSSDFRASPECPPKKIF